MKIFTKIIATALPLSLLFVAALPMPADAYQQTLTCTRSGPYACQSGETPLPVLWPGAQATFVINDQGTANSTAPPGLSQPILDTIIESFEAWNQVECPGFELPDNCSDMLLTYEGLTAQSEIGYDQSSSAQNTNLVIFRDTGWDQVASDLTFALTSVTYNPRTGQIVDADLEINSEIYFLNVGDPVDPNLADLKNTLVHEVGHFVGMDHSTVPRATMYASADLGETMKRDLAPDDIDGICASYPPDFVPQRTCDTPYIHPNPNPNPNEGHVDDGLADPQDDEDLFLCSTTPGGRRSIPVFFLGFAALLGLRLVRAGLKRA